MQGHLKPAFLTVEDVLQIHAELITAIGGAPGLRDLPLLESAVAQPMAAFGSQYLHDSPFMMAAAYLLHLCQNHAFVDGNKRTAYTASLVFLRINGIVIEQDNDALHDMVLAVAQGRMEKQEIARVLEDAWLAETRGAVGQEADPPDDDGEVAT